MGLTLTSVHETAKDPNTGMDRIVAENPYLRVKQGDYPPIYLQRGQVYDESGNIMKPIPDWAHEEIAKASPEALAKVGWKPKPEATEPTKTTPKAKPVKAVKVKKQAKPTPEPAEAGQEEPQE